MQNMDYVQLVLNSQISLQQSYELSHGIKPCPGRGWVMEGGGLGSCRGAWRRGRGGDRSRKRYQRPNMSPGLLENCAEIIFKNDQFNETKQGLVNSPLSSTALRSSITQSTRVMMDVIVQTYVALTYEKFPRSFLPQCRAQTQLVAADAPEKWSLVQNKKY